MAWDGINRRATDRRSTARTIEARMEGLEGRMHTVETDLYAPDGMRDVVRDLARQTSEMHEVFTAAKGGFQVITWVGNGAKPVLWIAAAISAVWIGIKTGAWHWPS